MKIDFDALRFEGLLFKSRHYIQYDFSYFEILRIIDTCAPSGLKIISESLSTSNSSSPLQPARRAAALPLQRRLAWPLP
jgi:hypothetical protein